MLVKVHSSYRDLVSICDEELIGKVFREGKLVLDIKQEFYSGDIKTTEETVEIIKKNKQKDATFIIIGKNSVDSAIESGVVDSKDIIIVEDIPFVLILL